MASTFVEVELYVHAAEVADEREYEIEPDDGGSENSEEEEEEEEEDEEEGDDQDYLPPGSVPVQSGAVDANAPPPIVVLEAERTQAEASMRTAGPREAGGEPRTAGPREAGGEPRTAGDEVLDGVEEAESGWREGRSGGGGKDDADEGGLGRSVQGDTDKSTPNCPICIERWTCQGVHRVCCIPCGHVYGRSCLESWVRRCGNSFARCPQCKRRFKTKDIINLYAPQVTVVNDDLEKEVIILREKNEMLSMERKKLLEEVRKLKKDEMGDECLPKSKKPCLHQAFLGGTQMKASNFVNDLQLHSGRAVSGPYFPFAHSGQGASFSRAFVLQAETAVDGARVLDIDACSQILLVSRTSCGLTGGHVLTKISFLCPNAVQNVQLGDEIGTIRDLHFAPLNTVLPGRLALLASLGKKLSVFSVESNNVVLKYNLPGPSWSCSWDIDAPYHIYAGLQDGTILMFDVRQTAKPLVSRAGLSRHPVHAVHSLAPNEGYGGRALLTASSVGLCLWDIEDSETSPKLVPELENQGVCISLACSSTGGDIVASFRPKVETNSDASWSQPSQSLSPTVSGPVRLGTHVFLKRVGGNVFQKRGTTSGNVSEVRMSRSAIVPTEGYPLFVYGDEAFHGLCVWDLASFQVVHRLKPHKHPILDIKYSNSMGPGLLGCVSENRLQVFRVH